MTLAGIAFFLGMGLLGAAAEGPTGASGGMLALFGALGAVAGVIFLGFAVLYFFVGRGLLNLKNWARVVVIVITAIYALIQVMGLVGSLVSFEIVSLVIGLCVLAIYGWILWYLFQPHVKAAFGTA